MQKNNQKTKDWETKKLGDSDFFSVDYGTRVVKKRDGGTIYDVYGGGGKTFHMDTFNRENCLVVSRFAMSEKCTRFVTGKFFLNDSGLTVSIVNKELIIQEYLNYNFLFLNDYIYSLGRGSAQRNLNVKKFKEIEISFPKSLDEQRRIVGILDEVFEKIDQAKTIAEQNLKNIEELFESELQNIFSNPAENWEIKKLGDIIKLEYGKPLPREKRYKEGKYPVYGANGIKDFSDEFYFSEKSIIVGRKGTAGALTKTTEKFWPLDVTYFVTFENNFNLDFIYYLLVTLNIPNLAKGVKPGINRNDVYDFNIFYPKSLDEQRKIVERLDELKEKVDEGAVILRSKITALDELKKSLLQKAFNGEL